MAAGTNSKITNPIKNSIVQLKSFSENILEIKLCTYTGNALKIMWK